MYYNSKIFGHRLKYIAITPDIVVDILYNHSKYLDGKIIIPIIEDLPKDCTVIGVDYDFISQCFRLILQHDSFEEIPEGEIIPKLNYSGIEFRSIKIQQEVHDIKVDNPFQKYRDLV